MNGAAAAKPAAARRDYWRTVLFGFVLAAIVLSAMNAHDIFLRHFADPDDTMRLLEVRDWLAGQSWWDVSQHRLGGGTVFQMHWSRLVDLPIAAVIGGLTPLIGAEPATTVALFAVPLLTLFCTMALASALTLRLNGAAAMRIAVVLAPITGPILAQMQPGRIDHHGWQIVMALAATLALATRTSWHSGVAAGLALATLVTISFEGLPFALGAIAIAAVAWAFDPARRGQSVALTATVAGWAVLLQLATRGPAFWRPACDAVAPAWLAALIVAALAFAAITALPMRTYRWRLTMLAVPGVASGVVLLWLAPDCVVRGPFGMLDPFVRHWWFDNISEGLPVWRQSPSFALTTLALPVVGMIGAILSLRRAEADRRSAWRMMIALQGCAFVLALLVMRGGGSANALAIPGAAGLVAMALERARKIEPVLPRILAMLGAFVLAAPSTFYIAALVLLPEHRATVSAAAMARPVCTVDSDVGALGQLPPSRLFAPIDVGPELLMRTRHEAVAGGYHRNNNRMHLVMAAFMGRPDDARRAIAATGSAYVVGCPGLGETELYAKAAPNGFWARLERGERFDWLQPVPIKGSPVLAWRVLPGTPPRR
ncbi:MAG: hypothetical protein J0J06_10080 [Sphingomonas sp.]|uniref:hypothetical protein n=1 Tax=Sphingomonas sp. TaxID=28214 RepID=UPI001AD11CCD|nr:hypothetical protein [Sphingomonas sp.]MBN8815783.1 hypothetical protein [Sphingomonas sp.]